MLSRRQILVLSGCFGFAATAGVMAWPRPALGFGSITLGLSRDETLAKLGQEAFAAKLCSGVDGALYDVRDPAFRTANDEPIPAMAMFGGIDGAVNEIEASLSWPDGGFTQEGWRALVEAQAAEVARRIGRHARSEQSSDDGLGADRLIRLTRSDVIVSVRSRWMNRSGASFSRLHWIGAGEKSVIG